MGEFASKGVAGAGLGTGIAGLALGVLNGGWLNGGNGSRGGGWGWNSYSNYYGGGYGGPAGFRDIELSEALAQRDMEIARLNAKTYSDESDLAIYKYFDGQIKDLNRRLCEQEVFNANATGTMKVIAGQVQDLQTLTASITRTAIPSSAICDFNSCNSCQRTTTAM